MKYVVAIVGLFAILAVFYIWWTHTPVPREVAVCQSLIPNLQTVGLGFKSTAENSIQVDFGGVSKTENPSTPEAYDAFIKCLEKTLRVEIVNGINIPGIQPLGAIANNWKDDQDIKLTLITNAGESSILNNLRFGPAVGKKSDILAEWCNAKRAGLCAKCNPAVPNESTSFVEISLLPAAPVKKITMPGEWNVPPKEPWELIEGGTRYLYECAP
jgi:hypothetical protein